jgi:hypothetical protein
MNLNQLKWHPLRRKKACGSKSKIKSRDKNRLLGIIFRTIFLIRTAFQFGTSPPTPRPSRRGERILNPSGWAGRYRDRVKPYCIQSRIAIN